MSGITTGVGLFSGLPTQDIIDQLIAAQARPLELIQKRLTSVQQQRTAFLDLNARLVALKGMASTFDSSSFFHKATATSSNPEIFTATAAEDAVPGSFAFRVHSLVTSHQLISEGFADPDTTAIGSGTLSFEIGHGRVGRRTFLDDLNGGEGVGRGSIRITDSQGSTADIDLSVALTIDDVLAAINSDGRISVSASVAGDRLVVQDNAGGATALSVTDIAGGTIAADLGIAGVAGADGDGDDSRLMGADINNVGSGTRLTLLNDGNGVRRRQAGVDLGFLDDSGAVLFEIELNDTMKAATHLAQLNDGNGVDIGVFEIHTADGSSFTIDLTAGGIERVQDVLDAINAVTGGSVTARLEPGTNHLQLIDNTTGSSEFLVVDTQGTSARDLGLTAEAEGGQITAADMFRISTLGDVVRAINHHIDNEDITASIVNNGLQLTRSNGEFTVRGGEGSAAALDLGLADLTSTGGTVTSYDLIAGLNTVLLRSLNGGSGVSTGSFEVILKSGQSINIDLTHLQNLGSVIDQINDAGASFGFRAMLNPAGNGILLIDESAPSGQTVVQTTATTTELNIAGSFLTAKRDSGNLQLQYLSEATLLSSMNGGKGLGTGEIRIVNRAGEQIAVQITDNQKTLGALIRQINNAAEGRGVQARINETGDGVQIIDTSAGDGTLSVSDASGVVAEQLNLTRDAKDQTVTVDDPDDSGNPLELDAQVVNGTFEFSVSVDADDTLNDIVDKINSGGFDISATIINDGSSSNAYRLSITSGVSGTRGELMFDAGDTGIKTSTMVRPQDAVVFFGEPGIGHPIVIRSSTNSLTNVVDNVTIDLVGTSQDVVELTVGRDVDSIVAAMQNFVNAYNGFIDRVEELTYFDSETLTGGLLRSDSTVRRIMDRVNDMLSTQVPTDNPAISRLAHIGISFENGGQLGFDETQFRQRFAEDPDAVEQLFTLTSSAEAQEAAADETENGLGLGHVIDDVLEEITRSVDGLLAIKDDNLEGQEELLNNRASQLLARLESSRARLERQFVGLEQALGFLSGQQDALNLLALQTAAAGGN